MEALSLEEEEFESYRYPWARSLFLVVLYAALIVFLWFFPLPALQSFFQRLLMGFLYAGAALVIVIITFVTFTAVLPPISMPEDTVDEVWEEDNGAGPDVLSGYAIAVPALMDPGKAEVVWQIIDEVAMDTTTFATITVDEGTGIISVTDEVFESNVGDLVHDIRMRLRDARLNVRKPRC
jgi:hypothetical protein